MRNDSTDMFGKIMTRIFKNKKMSIKDFIRFMVSKGAFDTTDTTFHMLSDGDIVSYYYDTQDE